jgi:ubiquinone/menaquinone biosynthesis C-methylase UbiE
MTYFCEEITMKKVDSPHHLFDPKNIAALESKERKVLQDPEKIIKKVGLKPRDIVADLGCGTGYFTVPISYVVKKVYAIDIQQEMLDYLAKKIRNQHITNIELVLSTNPKTIPLPNESVNFLLSVMTLHEFQDKEKVVKEMQRVLKPNGKIAIIDFKKQNTGSGPPLEIRISEEQTIKTFKNVGLKEIKRFDLKSYYLLVFEK